jgi:hypothetical protein
MTSMTIQTPMSATVNVPQPPVAAKAVMSPWMWMAVTCLLLAISGGVRYWRDWQFATLAVKSEATPFPLAELPRAAGTWQAGKGSETQLDPEVARIAGSSDHVVRNYLDDKTGDMASALILYGLASRVHTPEACYPSAGYKLIKGPIDRSIQVPGVSGPVRYRWATYVKRVGGINRYEEAFYTFRHNGEWVPDHQDRWKMFRYYPGLFKVQIAHPVSILNEDGQGPCEALLAEVVRQIDDRLSGGGAGQVVAPSPETSAPRPQKTD